MITGAHGPAVIDYQVGDATLPLQKPCVIAHVTNDVGAWGKGFTQPLTARYPLAASGYRAWAKSGSLQLGETLVTEVEDDVFVWHLCAQAGLPSAQNPRPFRVDVLDTCLAAFEWWIREAPRVQMPRIGVGLGRGNWAEIEPVIVRRLCPYTTVTVFDPPRCTLPPERYGGFLGNRSRGKFIDRD